MAEQFDGVVIGAGISGAATAYYLKRLGMEKVLLLERDAPAAGGTGKSAAIVRQHYSTKLMGRLAMTSIGIFKELEDELGCETGYRAAGYVFLAPRDGAEVAKRNVEMQQALGIETEWLTKEELEERFDWLNCDGLVGGAFETRGGYADPVQSTEAYVRGFEALGGTFRRRTPCRRLIRSDRKITGIETDDGPIGAVVVVNATGPWASFLAASVDLPLQMRTVREQDTIWEGRPGDVDPYNYKATADDTFIADVSARLEERIPSMAGARLVHAYAALYDVTVDWYPYVGPRVDAPGYCDFNGGSGHGFKIAPALAYELAKWIVNDEVASDFAGLSYDRVAHGNLFQQSYGGNRG
jgi:sarcosine oxidase subunit beta